MNRLYLCWTWGHELVGDHDLTHTRNIFTRWDRGNVNGSGAIQNPNMDPKGTLEPPWVWLVLMGNLLFSKDRGESLASMGGNSGSRCSGHDGWVPCFFSKSTGVCASALRALGRIPWLANYFCGTQRQRRIQDQDKGFSSWLLQPSPRRLLTGTWMTWRIAFSWFAGSAAEHNAIYKTPKGKKLSSSWCISVGDSMLVDGLLVIYVC